MHSSAMRIALYQPDIAQNCGTILRLAACLGIAVDIVEPCGFIFGGTKLRRAGMDYLPQVDLSRHSSWEAFLAARAKGRLILLTTKAATPYTGIAYAEDDTLLLGRESGGVPDEVHAAADLRVLIPMRPGMRSLNVAMAAAMVAGEALRQVGELG